MISNTKKGFGLTGFLISLIIVMLVVIGGAYVVNNTNFLSQKPELKNDSQSDSHKLQIVEDFLREHSIPVNDNVKDPTIKLDGDLQKYINNTYGYELAFKDSWRLAMESMQIILLASIAGNPAELEECRLEPKCNEFLSTLLEEWRPENSDQVYLTQLTLEEERDVVRSNGFISDLPGTIEIFQSTSKFDVNENRQPSFPLGPTVLPLTLENNTRVQKYEIPASDSIPNGYLIIRIPRPSPLTVQTNTIYGLSLRAVGNDKDTEKALLEIANSVTFIMK